MKPTSEQIITEPAGERLEAWVALYVLGLPYAGTYYSRCIPAAWVVVEKLMERWQVQVTTPWSSRARWCVMLSPLSDPDEEIEVLGSTAPLAICRAALLSVCDE